MKCPFCDFEIVLQAWETEKDEVKTVYGSPLRVCENCGKEFLSSKKEIALSGISFFDRTRIRFRNIIFTLGGGLIYALIILLIVMVAKGVISVAEILEIFISGPSSPGTYIGALIGVLFMLVAAVCMFPAGVKGCYHDLKDYGSRHEFFRAEEAASLIRCADENYVLKLKALGYEIKQQAYMKD